jgi:uncharacterized cupredoxin-like copper-binding protein
VQAKLSDFGIQVSSSTIKAGDVNFAITNAGKMTHEFVVVQTDLGFSQVPVTAEGTADEQELKGMGEVEDIEAGKSGDLKLSLPPGHYMLICNLPGHYASGMHADFVVTQ